MNNYVKGNTVRISGAFNDGISGAAVDPTTVSLAVNTPTGTTTLNYPADITKSATGRYYVDYVPLEVGHFSHQWTGTGTNPAVSEPVLFTVR